MKIWYNYIVMCMKKIIPLLIFIFIITGCQKNSSKPEEIINYYDDNYKVFVPYKEAVSANYIYRKEIKNYDIKEVESSLMILSKQYFKVNNSYYQAGQYLTRKKLDEILTEVNKAEEITVNNKKTKPNYISYIYEQNFLAKNGNLKGMSIGLVLNMHQPYKNSYGTTVYETIDENKVIEHGKKSAEKILKYLRQIEGIENTKVMVGLYLTSSPYSSLPGSFKYVGITNNTKVDFEKINYNNYYLNSKIIMEKDLNNYNNFNNYNNIIRQFNDSLYVSAKGLYINDKLTKIDITVNASNMNKGQLLALSNLIADEGIKNFDESISIKTYIKVNKEIKALIVKEENNLKNNIYILED